MQRITYFSLSVFKYTLFFLVMWGLFLNGCSSLRTLEQPSEVGRSASLVVTLTDSTLFWMENAHVDSDTLFGEVTFKRVQGSLQEMRPVETAIPVTGILQIRKKKTSVARTAFLVAGFLLVAGFAVGGAAVASLNIYNN